MCLGQWSNNKSRANHQTKEKFSKAKHNQPAVMCDDDFSEKKKFFFFFFKLLGNDPHHKFSVTSRRMCFSLSLSPQTKQRAKVDLSLETFCFLTVANDWESTSTNTTSSICFNENKRWNIAPLKNKIFDMSIVVLDYNLSWERVNETSSWILMGGLNLFATRRPRVVAK
jgi:hypothetical protein